MALRYSPQIGWKVDTLISGLASLFEETLERTKATGRKLKGHGIGHRAHADAIAVLDRAVVFVDHPHSDEQLTKLAARKLVQGVNQRRRVLLTQNDEAAHSNRLSGPRPLWQAAVDINLGGVDAVTAEIW